MAAAGAAISVYLVTIKVAHLRTGIPSACNFNEAANCDLVNTSRWAEIGGIPVAHFGLLSYLFLAAVAATALARERFRPRGHAYLFLMSLWCALFSAYLAFIAIAVLKSLCVWCASLYAVNAALVILLWGGGIRAAAGIPAHLRAEWRWAKRPAGALLVGLGVAAMVGSCVYIDRVIREAEMVAHSREAPRIAMQTTGLPARGPDDAKVTVVEISDFECPFCRKAAKTLAAVAAEYRGKVRTVFRNFPLDHACNPAISRPFHRQACAAATAAYCAGTSGFFWEYAESLFAGELDRGALIASAQAMGIDPTAFAACLDSRAAADAVARDIEACRAIGVAGAGVPFFLINGRTIVGAQPASEFKRIIDEELAAAR